jgi:uncharacterized protein (TIGR02246 family)
MMRFLPSLGSSSSAVPAVGAGCVLLVVALGLSGRSSLGADEPPAPVVAAEQDPAFVAAINAASAAVVAAFDANDPAALAAAFTEGGELVDENGTVHAGRAGIEAAFTQFFERFPGARLLMEVQDVRRVDETIAIEEGVRLVLVDDGAAAAQVRYVAVRTRRDDAWPIVSYREFADDPPPSAREMLAQLEWLVGDWIDESPDGRTLITFRWSEDGHYILGEFNVSVSAQPTTTSQQRIGWDPVTLTLRSWTFDADGGFSEGVWTPAETGWIVRSVATLPDGSTGAATLKLAVQGDDHVVISGADRVVAGAIEPDFTLRIARRQPRPDAVGDAGAEPANETAPTNVESRP